MKRKDSFSEHSERNWMQAALKLAQKAEVLDEVPVGAVVLRGDKIVGRGFNLREKSQNPTAHAEIRALSAAAKKLKSWRLTGCTLVVTLEPCPLCLAACQQSRIERVIFGAKDPKGGALSLGYCLHEDTRLHHRFAVEFQENKACSQILSEFFKKKRLQKKRVD